MIILASLLSSSQESPEESSNSVDIISVLFNKTNEFIYFSLKNQELRQNLFNLVDFIGIYFILRYKWTFIDDLPCRILSIAIGIYFKR